MPPARELNPRAFRLVLLLTALIGLALRIYVGRKTFISFDEWQHVFMAGSARWADLSFELRTNAHPPLFFLFLRVILKLGHVALYRSISIAAGVGSIVVVGLIARRLLVSPSLQLICAAAFALSADAISVSVEIRSYQLAVFFALLAFWAWLDMFPGADGRIRVTPCITFAICSSLALLSHYSAIFFLGACVVVRFLTPRFRGATGKSLGLAATALAFPCVLFAAEFLIHAGVQPIQGYLVDFYLQGTPNEPITSFVIRNSRNFFNLFSPIQVHDIAIFLAVLPLLCAATGWALLKRLRTLSGATIVFAIVMVLELLAASLANKYPFGGMLRHQYIAGPFLLIAAFAVLDALIPVAGRALRYAIPAVLLIASIGNAAVEVPRLIFYPGIVLLQQDFDAWHSAFPHARAVYVDHWGVIGYFIHTSNQPRSFVRHIAGDADIDEYRTPDGTEIFYDKTRAVLDLADPSVYRSFAACLRASGVDELTLFFYSPGDAPINEPSGKLESTVVRRAEEAGLTTTRVVVSRTSLAAGFKLR